METYDDPSGGAFWALLSILLIPVIVISIISLVGMWKVFEKAGKPGWAVLIPIYNTIVLLEITGKPIWWIFLMLIPCVNIVIVVWIYNLISKSFGQSEGFTVGLLLLPFIFFPILGFGNYKYAGPAGAGNTYPPYSGNDPFNNNPPNA